MRPGPALITNTICEELPLDSRPIKLTRLIEQIILDCFRDLDPIEKASEWEASVRSRLLSYIRITEERGAQPQIAFNSSSSYMVQGACFIEGTDSNEVVEQKKRRLRWKDYYLFLLTKEAPSPTQHSKVRKGAKIDSRDCGNQIYSLETTRCPGPESLVFVTTFVPPALFLHKAYHCLMRVTIGWFVSLGDLT